MNELIAWILGFMVMMSPPTDQGHRDRGRESIQETYHRYEEIANDLVEVVFNPNNKPLFNEEDGRSHTVAIMLSITFHESKFYKDIDFGYSSGRGDYGKSWCMMQIMAGRYPNSTRPWNIVYDRPPQWNDSEEEIEYGFTGYELTRNRKACFYEGLKMMRWSFSRCGNRDIYEKLRVYASGSCRKGGKASRARIWTGENYWKNTIDERMWVDHDIVNIVQRRLFERQVMKLLLWSPNLKLNTESFLLESK